MANLKLSDYIYALQRGATIDTTGDLQIDGSTILGDANSDTLTVNGQVTSFVAENDTAEGVNLAGYHDSESPAAHDVILNIRGRGNDSTGAATTFGQFGFFAIDPTDTQEAGAFFMQLAQPGDGENYGVMYVFEDNNAVGVTFGDIEGSGLQDVEMRAGQGGNGDFTLEAGNITLDGAIIHSDITATSGAGAVAITGRIHEVTTTGTGDALTLANGTAGQRLTVIYVAEAAGADTAVLTPTTLAGGTTITFNDVGDTAELVYSSTGGWYMVGGSAVLA